MNFRGKKKASVGEYTNGSVGNESGKLEYDFMFYKDPPVAEISLEEFEKFAVERLKLLREVENISIRFKRNSDEHTSKMRNILKDFLPEFKDSGNNTVASDRRRNDLSRKEHTTSNKRKDHVSHFILRLAFARSEDLRRWFLTQEMELFRYRFQQGELAQRKQFLKDNALEFDEVDKKSVELVEKLRDSKFIYVGNETIINDVYYKVPFTDVLDLVRMRKVYIEKGFAYVPHEELVSIIIGIYRTHLSQALAVTARKLPYLEEDTRLLPMLKNLSSAYIGDSYTSKKASVDGKLNLNEVDEAAKVSFPICMRHLNEGLRNDHHLKHFGRLQYGLFLKAAGLSLEEALLFWRTEFTKKMEVDKFEKQYAYNVRHSYGKEGKRADYTPYSCMKIITTNQPGHGDYHGCPFKHSDADVLQKRLQSYKVPKNTINEIIDLVKRQHFQVACARYFEVTHKLPEGTTSINHPNEYFLESRRVLKHGANGSTYIQIKQEVKRENPTMQNLDKSEIEGIDFNGMDEEMEVI